MPRTYQQIVNLIRQSITDPLLRQNTARRQRQVLEAIAADYFNKQSDTLQINQVEGLEQMLANAGSNYAVIKADIASKIPNVDLLSQTQYNDYIIGYLRQLSGNIIAPAKPLNTQVDDQKDTLSADLVPGYNNLSDYQGFSPYTSGVVVLTSANGYIQNGRVYLNVVGVAEVGDAGIGVAASGSRPAGPFATNQTRFTASASPAPIKATKPEFGIVDDVNNIVTLSSPYSYEAVRWGIEGQAAQSLASNSICSPGNIAGRLFAYVTADAASGRTQSDMAFSTIFTTSVNANNAPEVTLTVLGGATTADTGKSITLSLSGTDADGTVVKIEALDNGVKIGQINAASGTLVTPPLTTGSHSFTARAYDDKGATGLSEAKLVTASIPAYNSPFPVQLNITTPDITLIGREDVTVGLEFNNANGTAWPVGNLYKGQGTIKVRGNSTAQADKKPYSISLAAKFPLLGMYNDDSFVLLAEAFDPLLGGRNQTFFDLSDRLGIKAVKRRPCEVYVNNVYHGLYTITEKIKQAQLGIDSLGTAADNQVIPKIDGGYIIQQVIDYQEDPTKDKLFKTDLYGDSYYGWIYANIPHSILVEYPKPDKITQTQLAYIIDYTKRAEASLSKPWGDMANGPQAFFEPELLAKVYLLLEYSANVDAGSNSTFYYKNRGGKFIGTGWDADQAWPIHKEYSPKSGMVQFTPWFSTLFQDNGFLVYVRTVFQANYSVLAESPNYLQSFCKMLTDTGAAARNYAVWGGAYSIDGNNGTFAVDFPNFLNKTIAYMADRLDWMKELYGGFTRVLPYPQQSLLYALDANFSTTTLVDGRAVQVSNVGSSVLPFKPLDGTVGPTLKTQPDGFKTFVFDGTANLSALITQALDLGFSVFLVAKIAADGQFTQPLYFAPNGGGAFWYTEYNQFKTANGAGGYGNYRNITGDMQAFVVSGTPGQGIIYQTGAAELTAENPMNPPTGFLLGKDSNNLEVSILALYSSQPSLAPIAAKMGLGIGKTL